MWQNNLAIKYTRNETITSNELKMFAKIFIYFPVNPSHCSCVHFAKTTLDILLLVVYTFLVNRIWERQNVDWLVSNSLLSPNDANN